MERPVKRRRRLHAHETAARVSDALRNCRSERVVLISTVDAHFETAHSGILIDQSVTRQNQSWYFDYDARRAVKTALKTRQLAETLNALAHCEGYDPDESADFWRSQLLQLGDLEISMDTYEVSVITNETLASYTVYCGFENDRADAERLASVLFAAISPFPGSETEQIRQQVIATLGSFLVYRRTPRELSIEICTSFLLKEMDRTSRISWPLVRSTMFHLSRRYATAITKLGPQGQERHRRHVIQLVVATGVRDPIDDKGLIEIVEIAAMDLVAITRLQCTITASDGSTVMAFRRLMRALARADTLRAMTLHFRCYDDRYAAAICSALPQMLSLESCRINFQGLQSDAVGRRPATSSHSGAYYSWLTYAIQARDGRSGAHSLTLKFDATSEASMDILRSNQSVHVLAPCLPQRHKFTLQPTGTTALLCAGAALSTAVSVQKSCGTDISFTVESDSKLATEWIDVVAVADPQAIVVVPGIGFMWVDTASLSAWRSVPYAPYASFHGADHAQSLSNIRLVIEARHAVAAVEVVEAIGSNLTQLCLFGCTSGVSRALLSRLLDACPLLEKLGFVVTPVVDFQPLLDAYRSERGCHIKTIFSSDSNKTHATQLFQTFAFGLEELSIGGVLTTAQQVDLIRSLEANQSLRFFRCGRPHDPADRIAWRSFGLIDSARQHQTERSKRVAYTFLGISKLHQELQSVPLPCLRSVVEFAATPSRRHMSWHGV